MVNIKIILLGTVCSFNIKGDIRVPKLIVEKCVLNLQQLLINPYNYVIHI